MNKKETIIAVIYARVAAALYAINVPCSKMLLTAIPPVHHHRVEELEECLLTAKQT